VAPFARSFRHRDYRLLWTGAFLSFLGSWIQTTAQGWFVYELTGDKAMLGLVVFCSQIPVMILGPVAGTLPDMMNRRIVLVCCQLTFSIGSLFLAAAIYFGFIHYYHILAVALVSGIAGAIEMPTRQSIVSKIVPPEDLPSAIPLNALTFNFARVVGPILGMVLYAAVGPQLCYLINGLSFFFLIFAVLGIRTELRAERSGPQPVMDLVMEGVLYTFREPRLKTLFLLEGCVAVFGLFYLAQMPAIAVDILGLTEAEFGLAMTAVGVGTISSLLLMANLSHRPIKGAIVRWAMTVFGVGLFGLGFATAPWAAFPLLALIGFCAVAQFNTTNTLFQLLSPDRLRGRVLAMHVWALAGLGPIGTIAFSWLAEAAGLTVALQIGGLGVLLGALWGWTRRGVLEDLA
jgi:MFS family permease